MARSPSRSIASPDTVCPSLKALTARMIFVAPSQLAASFRWGFSSR
jgi:hypothetical protein